MSASFQLDNCRQLIEQLSQRPLLWGEPIINQEAPNKDSISMTIMICLIPPPHLVAGDKAVSLGIHELQSPIPAGEDSPEGILVSSCVGLYRLKPAVWMSLKANRKLTQGPKHLQYVAGVEI